MIYNHGIIKVATSIKYLHEILGLPLDLAQSLLEYFRTEVGGDKTKANYYMSHIRKNISEVVDNAERLKEDPSFLETMFPFVGQEKKKHKYHDQIQYMTAVNRKYAPWVTELIDSGKIQEEDFIKVKNLLERHAELVRKGTISGEAASIDYFEDDSDLFRFLKQYQVDSVGFEELMKLPEVQSGSKIIKMKQTDDHTIIVIHVWTYPAMKALAGKDSAWCVAQNEGTFSDYKPSDYFMFFFNGEPEILIHKESDQIKAQDDSTSFDPFMIYEIQDIVRDLDLNTGQGDFEDYIKVLAKFEAYAQYDHSTVSEYIREDPMQIIYVDPKRYGDFIHSFISSMRELDPLSIERFPRSFLQYLGQYLKINGMETHFRLMENLINDYLNAQEYFAYFKKIPDVFHTTYVYENGYMRAIIEHLSDSFSLHWATTIMEKLNPKEQQREDVVEAYLEGIAKSSRSSSEYDFKNILSTYKDIGTMSLYAPEEQVTEAILGNVAKAISANPDLYRLIEDEEIKQNPVMFEATKSMLKVYPDRQELVPKSIRYNFRFAILRGYMDLAKKVVKGEESYERLVNPPEFVRRNPKYMRILREFEPNASVDLAYKLNELVRHEDHIEPSKGFDYNAYHRIRNLLEDTVTQEELLDPKNFKIVLDFISKKGTQYIYLPKSLRRNPEIIQAAVQSIISHGNFEIRRAYFPEPLNHALSEARDKQSEESELSRKLKSTEDQLTDEEAAIYFLSMFEGGKSPYSITHVMKVFRENPGLEDNMDVIQQTADAMRQKIKESMTETFYLSAEELKAIDQVNMIYSVYVDNFLSEDFWISISRIFVEKLQSSEDDADLLRNFRNIVEHLRNISEVLGINLATAEFKSQTHDLAVRCALYSLNQSERVIYSIDEMKELNTLYDRRIVREESIYSHARQLAERALQERNFSWFARIDSIFGFSKDPQFMQGQEAQNLYSGNWYTNIKTGGKRNKRNWYRTSQENLWDYPFDREPVYDTDEYYEDLEEREYSNPDDIYCGRRVCWIGEKGRMVRVERHQIYPIQGNLFEFAKYNAVIDKIENAEDTVYFYAPYGDMSIIDIGDIKESIEYGEDYGFSRNLTTGDEELDEFIVSDEEDYDEEELARLQEKLQYAIDTQSGDIGNLMFQVRDGNHRAFGAFGAGEPYIWVMLSSNQYNDIQRGTDWSAGYAEYLQ